MMREHTAPTVLSARARAARLLLLLLAPWLLLAGGCQEFDFEERWELRKLRTVAVVASPPEVGPGETVTLQAVSHAPSGTVTHTWELCLFPGRPDEGYPCEVPEELEGLPAVALGEGDTVSLTNPLPAEEIDAFCDQILAATGTACALGLPVTLRVTARVGSEERVSIRPLLLLTSAAAEREDRNTNPTPLALTWNGTVLSPDSITSVQAPADDDELLLQLVVDPTDAQAFRDPRTDEPREETLTAAWYTSAGELEYSRTFFGNRAPLAELQRNVLRSTADRPIVPGEEVALIVVLRDNRGGVGVLRRSVRVADGPNRD